MADIQEKLLEMELDNGEDIFVQRLSPFARQQLTERSKQEHPDPDPKDYEQPLANPLRPGLVVSGKDSDEYKLALSKAAIAQTAWLYNAVLQCGVVIDTPEGREATIARYRERLKYQRALITMPEDEWLATVHYGLLSTVQDKVRVVKAAFEQLSQTEVHIAIRAFRGDLQRRTAAGDTDAAPAPGDARSGGEAAAPNS